MSLEDLELQISNLKEELNNVKGTETEVYSRIVGYYRAVNNWNNGKKEEYGMRKSYAQLSTCCDTNVTTFADFTEQKTVDKSISANA